MSLTPAIHCLLVEPSLVEAGEEQSLSGLHVVTHTCHKIYRGILIAVGAHVNEALEPGEVVHYTDFAEVEKLHIVPETNLLAFGTRE